VTLETQGIGLPCIPSLINGDLDLIRLVGAEAIATDTESIVPPIRVSCLRTGREQETDEGTQTLITKMSVTVSLGFL
jgi:hypothetical protein